ncbi:MAG: hypothetical protein M1832_001084 [Thelocarpon impressellum]|nr:MAG: hypothetical protein M1832_001084 [Thelocarpon impressellum]
MVQSIPSPDARLLLPPLLACLPAAFASRRPVPALLPLLTPILRQRVQLLAPGSESWLPLLCWDAEKGARLASIVASGDYELHPVSGEVDFGDVEAPRYRRLDEETLQARLALPSLRLDVSYLWCVGDQAGGADGWRVGELSPADEPAAAAEGWHSSRAAADGAHSSSVTQAALCEADKAISGGNSTAAAGAEDDDDGDAYWGRYDSTPSRTPAAAMTPVNNAAAVGAGRRAQAHSDEQYYAQYNEVQPAMDGHDPAEAVDGLGGSSLDGEELKRAVRKGFGGFTAIDGYPTQPPPYEVALPVARHEPGDQHVQLDHPRPSTSSSSSSRAVSRLEDGASIQSQSEVGIKQHIGATMKSLHRLARAAGIERDEFGRLVRTELEVLELMEDAES